MNDIPYIVLLYQQARTVQGESIALKKLRDLALSALLQLERMKEEMHRMAPDTSDVRVRQTLVHAAALINEMRHGPDGTLRIDG